MTRKELGYYSSDDDLHHQFPREAAADKDRLTETETRDRLLQLLSNTSRPVPEVEIHSRRARLDRGLRSLARGHAGRGHEALDFARPACRRALSPPTGPIASESSIAIALTAENSTSRRGSPPERLELLSLAIT